MNACPSPTSSRTYLAPERDPGDQNEAAALTVLAELLGGTGQTSVLARALQFDDPEAVYTSAFYDGTSLDDGTFGLSSCPPPASRLDEAEAAMDAVMDRVPDRTAPIPPRWSGSRPRSAPARSMRRDDVKGLARRYGEALTIGLTVADIEGWPECCHAVTRRRRDGRRAHGLDRRNAVTGLI